MTSESTSFGRYAWKREIGPFPTACVSNQDLCTSESKKLFLLQEGT